VDNLMILRRWTARVRTKDVPEYARYVEITGAEDYHNSRGYLGHQIVVRELSDGVSEFSTLSWWTSMAAVQSFAGPYPELARYYPEDDRFLLSRPDKVEHFRVLRGARPATD
jgi:heme-degrading monooxygenase HmoA